MKQNYLYNKRSYERQYPCGGENKVTCILTQGILLAAFFLDCDEPESTYVQ